MFYSTHVINSGTFQDRTAYQLKQGHLPTPGKLPILELKNNNIHIWDAYGN
jgi:DNA polymerase II small subunit/DNA polymerase delta subunit B